MKENFKKQEDYIKALEKQAVKLQNGELSAFNHSDLDCGVDAANYFATITLSESNQNNRPVIQTDVSEQYSNTNFPVATDVAATDPRFWDQWVSINPLANHQSAIGFVF
jgi:hypothetical protein